MVMCTLASIRLASHMDSASTDGEMELATLGIFQTDSKAVTESGGKINSLTAIITMATSSMI